MIKVSGVKRVWLVTGACISIMLTGCSSSSTNDIPTMEELIPNTSYDSAEYDELYEQLREGMTLEEVSLLFDSSPDSEGELWEQNGKKNQTLDWFSHDRKTNIGCDFVDNVCEYKNGWSTLSGQTVYKRQ